jgi:hypothetical protein
MEDDRDGARIPVAWGDMGALALAGGASLFALFLIGDMLMGGHPLEALFPAPRAAATPSEQDLRNAPMRLAPGEVRIFIPSKPERATKAPPKP